MAYFYEVNQETIITINGRGKVFPSSFLECHKAIVDEARIHPIMSF